VAEHRPRSQAGNCAIAVDPLNSSLIYLSGDAGVSFLQTAVSGGPFGPIFTPFTIVARGALPLRMAAAASSCRREGTT